MNIALSKKHIWERIEKICIKGDEANADIILFGDSNARMWFNLFLIFLKKKTIV